MRRSVLIGWQLSSFFGWGVYGINLALQWANDPDIQPVSVHEVDFRRVRVDPLARLALQEMARESGDLAKKLAPRAGPVTAQAPMLLCLNDRMAQPPVGDGDGVVVSGQPSIGVTFSETARLSAPAVERARGYAAMVAGSRWNAEVLRAHGLAEVTTVLQGVDPALFHVAPRRGLLPDRFLVFSGGKLERRKGQDLVVAAFARFARTRPEALLVTAWHSPWPELSKTLDRSGHAAPVVSTPDGQIDVAGWAAANGIPASQILDLGLISNAELPPLLREMDVAVFPNRCEGGTNLVAMEAMACGVPTILSANTGHLDLIDGEANCYPLTHQTASGEAREVGFEGVPGWGESDIDEIVAALEAAYDDRTEARQRGLAGATTLEALTWRRTAEELKATVLAT